MFIVAEGDADFTMALGYMWTGGLWVNGRDWWNLAKIRDGP